MVDSPAEDPEESTVQYRERRSSSGVLELRIQVREDGVYLRYEPLHGSFQRLPFEEIEEVTVAPYSPTEYGSINPWTGTTQPDASDVYRIDSDAGVSVTTTGGRKVFIGTGQPGELAATIADLAGVSRGP